MHLRLNCVILTKVFGVPRVDLSGYKVIFISLFEFLYYLVLCR